MSLWVPVQLAVRSFQLLGEHEAKIPAVCPNCAGAATVDLRYGHPGLLGPLSKTTYYQTFRYCPYCAEQAGAALSISASVRWFGLLGFFLGAVLFVAIKEVVFGGFSTGIAAYAPGIGFGLGGAAALGLWVVYRKRKRAKYPLKDNQTIWGPAAYHAGSKYLAVRAEWIHAFVKLNPGLIDEATYERWIGERKPQSTPA